MRKGWMLGAMLVQACCFSAARTSPECAATIDAAVRGDLTRLATVDVELFRCRDATGFEPIHHAAYAGRTEVVTWLLDHGVPIEAPGERERTAFYQAIRGGRLDTATALLDRGANLETRNDSGHTPWLVAAEIGGLATLAFLLERGADTRAVNRFGLDSVLAHVANRDRVVEDATVLEYLLAHGGEVDLHETDGFTALHIAVRRRAVTWTRTLLEHGANPNAVTTRATTPLGIAETSSFPELVTLLREHGARRSIDATVEAPALLTSSFELPGTVTRSSGARPAPLGTRCTVRIRPQAELIGSFNCSLAVDCDGGGHLYGGPGVGAAYCEVSSGNLRAFDAWPTSNDGDPAAELDRAARRFWVDDGLPGREGTRVLLELDPPSP